MTTSTLTEQALFIDGRWVPASATRVTRDKWDGAEIGRVAVATVADAERAVDAAARALLVPFPAPMRSAVLERVSVLLADRAEEVAQLITAEIGKPITAARMEVGRGVTTLQLAAEEARRLPGETVALDAIAAGEGTFAFTIPIPRGIVAAITPFNFPLNLLVHKLGPAIAAGCPVVLKPSDHAPLTAGLVVQLFHEAGLPAGRLNLVTGPPEEIVGAWQRDDRVAVITFTGSSTVGWKLKADSPRKHHILELGSNTAMVVMGDADLEMAATSARDAALTGSGQACVSLQRIYVDTKVANIFIDMVAARFDVVSVGDPSLPETLVGPLITEDARDRLLTSIETSVADGSELRRGGRLVEGVLAPTIVVGAGEDDPLICDEVFGPVVTIVVVDGLDDAIARVNASDYGLNTSIYTRSLPDAMAFAHRAEAGSVLVNMPPSFRADHMPYGGVKGSGQGREGVRYAIADLLQEKLVILHP